jgi:predicted site-specific integrase-resolvase
MDVRQAANLLGITEERIRKYCQAGRMGTKVKGKWVITPEEFERFKQTDYTGERGRPKGSKSS